MFHRIFLPIVIFLIALATLSCGQGSPDNRSDSDGVGGFSPAAEIEVADFPIDEYFDDEWQSSDDSVAPPFALSEGQLDWDAGEARPPLAQVTALTQEKVQSLLNRLPPFHALEGRCRASAVARRTSAAAPSRHRGGTALPAAAGRDEGRRLCGHALGRSALFT